MIGLKSWVSVILKALIYAVLALTAIVSLAPLIYTIAISFSDSAAANAGIVYFWPVRFTLASYGKMLADNSFFKAFLISVERVLLGGSINLAITIMMAYPLSKDKKEFRQRTLLMWLVVFTMLFSGGLIPLYITVKTVGILDSIWALVLPGAVPVFLVILLMNFFRSVPKELAESATIDGAGPWNVAARIYVPVTLPAIATVTLFIVVNHWNDFFSGLILLNTQAKYPLQTYIYKFILSANDMSQYRDPAALAERMKVSSRTFDSAKVLVSTVPILCIYPFLQRYFITGIVMGAVKE